MGTQADNEGPTTVGRRTDQRARLHLNATLSTTAQDHDVILRNLSCTGAMVQAPVALPTGRTVALQRAGFDELAVIVWCRRGFCGLEFLDPIELETVLAFAALPVELPAAPKPVYLLPGDSDDRLSEADWLAAKEAARRRLRRG